MGDSFTEQLYLGADATARSVRTVTGVPGVLSPTPVAGDLALSSNGSAYLYSGSAWQSLIVAPAGATTQVQYNNAGAFGASANFTYSTATNRVTLSNFGSSGYVASNTTGDTVTITSTGITHATAGATTAYAITSNKDLNLTSSLAGGFTRLWCTAATGTVSVRGPGVQVLATTTLTLGSFSGSYEMPLTAPNRGQVLQLPTTGGSLLNWAFGNQQEFGTLTGVATQATILANSYFLVTGAVTLPTLSPSATYDGLLITLVNNTLSTIAVTPPVTVGGYNVQRTMTVGGGSQWVWSFTRATWMCVSNV